MSLHRTPPKRLKETHAGLQELSERSFSSERLEANQRQIEQSIQTGPLNAGWASKGKTIGLSTGIILTALSIWFALNPPEMKTSESPINVEQASELEITQTAPLEQPKVDSKRRTPQLNLKRELNEHKANDESRNRQKPSEEEGKFKSMEQAPLRIAPKSTRQNQRPATEAPKPDLGAELEAFQRAKTYFENQDYQRVQETLAEMRKKFENPRLQIEITLLTVQTLLATQELDPALSLLQNLMNESSSKPQAQWHKLLGDIQKARNQCGAALIAYSKALKMGLSDEQENQVRVSVRACSAAQ